MLSVGVSALLLRGVTKSKMFGIYEIVVTVIIAGNKSFRNRSLGLYLVHNRCNSRTTHSLLSVRHELVKDTVKICLLLPLFLILNTHAYPNFWFQNHLEMLKVVPLKLAEGGYIAEYNHTNSSLRPCTNQIEANTSTIWEYRCALK